MRLQHTTRNHNLPSIKEHGLLCSKSEGRMQVVWLHDEAKTAWAFLHCVKRHGGAVQNVVSLLVDVPDELVRCSAVPGLFYIAVDVPPESLIAVLQFGVVAASPLES